MPGYDKKLRAEGTLLASSTIRLSDLKINAVNNPRDNSVWSFTIANGDITVTPIYKISGVDVFGDESFAITATNPLAIHDVDDWEITETAATTGVLIVSAGLGTA